MRAHEKLVLKNITATALFQFDDARAGTGSIQGGLYCLAVIATWGGGSVQLEGLGPDGSTQITYSAALTANGGVMVYLPPGEYTLVVTTATGVYASLTRIPIE